MQTGHGAMIANDCLDRDFCFDFPALLDEFVSSLRRVLLMQHQRGGTRLVDCNKSWLIRSRRGLPGVDTAMITQCGRSCNQSSAVEHKRRGVKGHIKRANRALKLSLLYVDNPVQTIDRPSDRL
jgi:hypothetical protein